MLQRARALIIDGDPSFRATLRAALGVHVHVVGEVPDEAEACAFISAGPVDLIVMSAPRPGGFEAARELLERDPSLVLVLLNSRGDGDGDGATTAHAYAPSAGLRELLGVLVGLGSLPRRPGGPVRRATPSPGPRARAAHALQPSGSPSRGSRRAASGTRSRDGTSLSAR
ncbi:MAG: response regulator [Actinobacteria bacterium]|nr:MAG: response regulator [Actinomycetota bacterium]